MARRRLLIVDAAGSADVRHVCESECAALDIDVEFRDAPGDLAGFDGLVINPGDAATAAGELAAPGLPVVDVRLDNPFATGQGQLPLNGAPDRTGFVCGLGIHGYRLAIRSLATRMGDAR